MNRVLALSGGGFRATLFSLGALWRLNDAGYLPELSRITSVSGGTITAAYLAAHWKELIFDASKKATNFEEIIVKPLRALTSRTIDTPNIIKSFLPPFFSVSNHVESAYEKYLFQGKRLSDILDPKDGPEFIFYATNLQTGRSVRMQRERISDYSIGNIKNPTISLAKVVTASSAFPPFLSPVIWRFPTHVWRGKNIMKDDRYRTALHLTDGGVYDNLGLEAAWGLVGTDASTSMPPLAPPVKESVRRRFDIVVVCDAGKPFTYNYSPKSNWLSQTLRVTEVLQDQIGALRKRWLLSLLKANCRGISGAYFGIASHIENYGLDNPIISETTATIRSLAEIRTRLNAFTRKEQGQLINWGYVICDTAIRRHIPELQHAEKGVLPIIEQDASLLP